MRDEKSESEVLALLGGLLIFLLMLAGAIGFCFGVGVVLSWVMSYWMENSPGTFLLFLLVAGTFLLGRAVSFLLAWFVVALVRDIRDIIEHD